MRNSESYAIQRATPSHEKVTVLSDPAFDPQTGPDLRHYWRVLRKHQGLIGLSCFSLVLLTLFVVLSMTPVYTAETTLMIEPQSPNVLDFRQAQPEYIGPEETSYYKTQYEILKSRELAAEVIRSQGLEEVLLTERTNGLLGGMLSTVQSWASSDRTADAAFAENDFLGVNVELIEEYLEEMLEVQPIRQTRLVRVAFHSSDPDVSSRVANAHAAAYIQKGLEMRSQTSEEAEQFLEEKLVELKERIEQSEAALNQYRRDKGVISLDDKENIVVERLSDLNMRLTEAEAERITLEAQVYLIRKKNYDSLPAVSQSPLIQTLREELSRLEGEHANLRKKYTRDYPAMQQLTAQLQQVRERLSKETRRLVQSVQAEFLAAEKKESELRAKMDEQKAATLGLKDAAVDYAILAREVDTNRQLYDSVLQRMKEMGVAAELRTSNVSILDRAAAPSKPSSPRKILSLLVSALVGLMGGVSLAFFFEYLDNTFKTPEDVEQYLELSNLAVVPDFMSVDDLPQSIDYPKPYMLASRFEAQNLPPSGERQFGRKQPNSFVKQAQALSEKGHRKDCILPQHPLSLVTEAYRTLRVNLLLAKAGGPPRTMMFTSANSAEGKTASTVNTALVFAQMGVTVLVIDCDLRRPRCHRILRLTREPGLTEVLTGQLELQDAIQPSRIENLSFLSCGALAPNPAELLSSKSMQETLTALQQHYDYIFIDTPPVLPVSDALLLTNLVDGVILVVKGQETPKHLVKETRARLGYTQAKILGVLLNKVNMKNGDYAYSYGQYYTYYQSPQEREVA